MADKLTDEIKLLFRTSIQDKDIKEVSKNIKSALENAVITFDEAEIKKEIVPVIQMLQKLFAKAEMKFDAEKLFAMPSREALQKIANISVDKFQAAFDRALEKSGGVKIDFGDFDFSSLTTSLGRVEKDLERVSNKIANTTKKSVSDIEESIKRLNKIETKTINSKKPADGSTETVKTKETVQTNKLDTTVGSIEKLFSDIDSGNKTNATQIKNAYKKYIKTIENNDPWEIQYQAIVEYVAKFESLSAKTKGKLKELPDFQKLYDSLSPKAGAARESLHNLVSTARGGELAEYKNQPWAREKTLERVARTLENGISVKEDGGSSNGNSNSTPNKDDEENTRIRNQRRLELSSQLEQLGDEPEDLNTLEQGLAKRKEIFELLKKEDLLTDEIQASYDSSNKDIEAKIKLLRKAAKEDEKITQSIKERQYEAYRAVESPEKSGKSKKDAIDDYGAEYWASTKEGAESYANNQFGLSSIISAQIKPVNPLVIDAQEAIWNDWENIPGLKDLFPGLLDVVQESGYDDEIQKYINEQAKLAGFDSVIFKNVQDNFDADLDDDAPIMDTIAVLDDRIVSLTGSFTELESRTENGDKMFSETMSKVPEYYVPSDNTGSESYLSELREKQTKSQEWYDDTISRLEDELEKRQEELSAAKQKLSENPKSYTAKETVKEASYAVKDTEKLIETLNKNKVISQKAIQIEIDGLAKVSDISDEVAADIQAETTAHQQNTEAIKQEVAAEKELNDVKTQVIDTDDDAETIAKENGALADKLELLRDIAEQYGNNITQKTRNRYEELNQKDMNDGLTEKEEERFSELGDQIIEADEALEEFEKTYDKIILKLANGKKVEILPDDKGLRSLYNFADGYGEEYNGVEIDDVIYQRVQKEAVTHQENAAAIVAETQAQEQLNENLKEKEVIENSDNNEELSDIKAETDAINQQNEALKENIDLKAKANAQDSSNHILSSLTKLEEITNKSLSEVINDYDNLDNSIKQNVDSILQSIGLMGSDGQFLFDRKQGGNAKAFVTDNFVILQKHITTNNEEIGIFIEKLQQAKQEGIQLAEVLGQTFSLNAKEDIGFRKGYEIQERGEGSEVHASPKLINLNQALAENQKILNLSDEHLQKFILDYIKLDQIGLQIDPSKPSNFLLDAEKGITFIDIGLKDVNAKAKSTADIFTEIATILSNMVGYMKFGENGDWSKSSGQIVNRIRDIFAQLNLSSSEEMNKIIEERFVRNNDMKSVLLPENTSIPADSSEAKASIDTEELRSLLNSITYNVKVIQDAEPTDDNKVSINVDELRSVLDGITYNVKLAQGESDGESNKIAIDEGILENVLNRITYDVKITHDDADKTSNKIAIDESALEQTLNRVFSNILSPKDDGKKPESKKEPWALEKTLNTTIKGVLDQIQTNTAKVDVPPDTMGASESTTKLAEIKSILESINAKIVKGGVIATRGAVKQAGAQAVEPDVQRQAARSNMMKSIINDYKTMGKLAAQFASDGNLETKAMLENLKEEIRRKRSSLNITMQENANLREKYSIAFEAEKRLLEAEEQQRKINEQNKSDAKAEKKRLTDAKKLAQREAMVGKAGNAVGRAENTWMTAVGMEDELPKEFGVQLDGYYQKLDALRKKQAELKNSDTISEEQKSDLITQTNNVNKLTEEIGGLIAEYQRLSGDNVDPTTVRANTIQPDANMDTYEQQLKNYVREITNGKGQIKGFNAETQTLTYTVKTGAHEFTTYTAAVRHLDDSLVSVRGATKKTETFLEATARKMKEISSYMSGMALISRVGQELRRGIQYVREIDLALTELKKVTDETEAEYDQFLRTAAKTGARLGTTISAVTEATSTFAKLGYSMEQAREMAESAIVYKNVGDNIASTEDAADSIISTLKGFGLEVTDTMKIVDSFNEVGNRFAITSQGIGEALRLSASALNEGGNSLHESIGLITAANEVVNDPSSVGTALKTLTLRLRGSKTELEEMGEDVSDMATTTSQLQAKLLALTGGQVDIMLDENTFKNSAQILREMAGAWEDMTDIQRASALELMGGKRQANVLSALISNFDTVEKVIKTSANSAGSALEENERYLDSIQGKIDQFNNAMQAMWSNTLDSDMVKGFVSLGTEIIKIIDKIGLLNSALIALATYSMIKNKMGPIAFFGSISDLIRDVVGKVGGFIGSLTGMTAATSAYTAETLAASVANGTLSASEAASIATKNGLTLATTNLTAAEAAEMLMSSGVAKADALAMVAKLGLTSSTQALSLADIQAAVSSGALTAAQGAQIASALGLIAANTGLTASLTALWAALWPILAVMAGIAALYGIVKLFDAVTVSAKEASEQLEETKNKISDLESELESLRTELDAAREKIAELTALPYLSLTQQEDLDRLEREVELLERQIALKERQLAIEEAKLVEDAEIAVEKNWGPTDKNKKDKKKLNKYIEEYEKQSTKLKDKEDAYLKASKEIEENQALSYETWKQVRGAQGFDEKYLTEDVYKSYDWDNLDKQKDLLSSLHNEIETTEAYLTNTASKIEEIFNDPTYAGLTYGMSDEIDAFLDDFNNAQLKWEKALYGDNGTANIIESLWGPNASEEMKAVKSEIDKIMAEDGNWASDDEKWQSKNDAIKAYVESLDETADGYHQLDYVMNDLGVTSQDVADYFTILNGTFDSNTIEGITRQYQKGMEALEQFKNNQTVSYTNQDGVEEQVDWEKLFNWDEAKREATANADVIAKVLKGADKETREQFGHLVETVAEGNLDFEQAIKSFGLSGALRGFELVEEQVAALNADIFKDLDDELSGVIDTFSEFGAALESVANSMEILNTAQTQMNNSGRISVKTALDLINSTDRWNEVLRIENGTIRLVDNAEDILIQTKLDHIKTNLQAALSTVNAQLAQIEATGSAEELATTLEESTNMAVRSLAENMSYLSTLVGEFAAGNWFGATQAAADAKAATANQLNYKRGTSSNISTAELEERKRNIEAQIGMLDGIDTTQEFKDNYDFDKTPGDKYDEDSGDEDDAFQRAMDYWENRIAANQARYEQLQNEIDLLEAKGQKADASYYEEQIKLENERLSLLQQQKVEAQSFLGTFAEGSDEWFRKKPA